VNRTLRYGDPEEVGMSPERLRRVARLAERWVADGQTPALVLLVARRGVVVLHEAFGRLGPEPVAPPLPADAVFPLGSIAKPITATAVMCLVEDGLLGLNRPVQEYAPDFVGAGKERVMVHHLLTHSSGLRDEEIEAQAASSADPAPAPEPGQHPWLAEYLFRRRGAPLWKPPGAEMSYCSYGYALLGDLVRRVSGRPLSDVARERIFGPLGMRDSWYAVPDAVVGRIVRRPPGAPGYGPIGPFPPLDGRERREGAFGSGAAHATAFDVAVFAQMFLNGGAYGAARVLSAAAVREMTRNQIPGLSARFGDEHFPEAGYGLGWDVLIAGKRAPFYGSLHSERAFGHPGHGGVFVLADPACELTATYFSVVTETHPNGLDKWNADLFSNAAMAAVDE
jgi:CubicO group peptidase (beta-lactamase class C family)